MMSAALLEGVFFGGWFGLAAAILTSFAMAAGGRLRQGESLVTRSHCTCGEDLSAFALIPVLGWLLTGGRARCCRVRIPLRFPVAEAAGFAAALLACVLGGLLAAAVVVLVWPVCAGALEFRRTSSH